MYSFVVGGLWFVEELFAFFFGFGEGVVSFFVGFLFLRFFVAFRCSVASRRSCSFGDRRGPKFDGIWNVGFGFWFDDQRFELWRYARYAACASSEWVPSKVLVDSGPLGVPLSCFSGVGFDVTLDPLGVSSE